MAFIRGTKREINTTNLLFGAQPHALTFAKIALDVILKVLMQHLEAVELETHRLAAERSGGVHQAFQAQLSLQKQAINGVVCIGWCSRKSHTQPNIHVVV